MCLAMSSRKLIDANAVGTKWRSMWRYIVRILQSSVRIVAMERQKNNDESECCSKEKKKKVCIWTIKC